MGDYVIGFIIGGGDTRRFVYDSQSSDVQTLSFYSCAQQWGFS